MLKRVGGKWCAYNEKGTRSFGCYTSKARAKKRLQQMEMWKHIKKHIVLKIGTESSGHFRHAGRIGRVGGSLPRGASELEANLQTLQEFIRSPEEVRAHEAYLARRRARHAEKVAARKGKVVVTAPIDTSEADRKWLLDRAEFSTLNWDDESFRLVSSRSSLEEMESHYDAIFGDNKKMSLATFVRQAYEFSDTENSGLHSKVEYVNWNSRIDAITIEGEILDEHFAHAGVFKRNLFISNDGREIEVHNDFFELNDSNQGSGFGSAFYRNAEEVYQRAGVDKITIFADLSVGGYAWARMGFDFRSESDREEIKRIVNDRLTSMYDIDTPEYEADVEKLYNSHYAWELAALTDHAGERIGKQVMIGSSWYGIKRLTPGDPGYKVGREYYDLKDKEKKRKKSKQV